MVGYDPWHFNQWDEDYEKWSGVKLECTGTGTSDDYVRFELDTTSVKLNYRDAELTFVPTYYWPAYPSWAGMPFRGTGRFMLPVRSWLWLWRLVKCSALVGAGVAASRLW